MVLRAGSGPQGFFGDDGKRTDPIPAGTRGVILGNREDSALIRLDDGRSIEIPVSYGTLDLAYARSLRDVASQRLEGEVHAVLDGDFHDRTTRALQTAAASADIHIHAASEVHRDGLPSMVRQVTRKASRDLAHDQASAVRRYEQLARGKTFRPSLRAEVEKLGSRELSGESKADLMKRLGAPEWSNLYETLDQPTTDSWTDWHVRRRVLEDARRTQVEIGTLEQLQAHVDGIIPRENQAWLKGAAWRELQRMAPGRLGTLLSLSRTAAAIARDPKFLLRLVEPRALSWARIALRVTATAESLSRSQSRDPSIER